MIVLCLFISSGVSTQSVPAYAAGAGEQEFSKGEDLLKNKQYAEARASLEAGVLKDPSNVQAHVNLAETYRGLET